MIPISVAIDFLAQAAPRPWVTRMLHAMLLNDELQAFFLSGLVRSEVMVGEIVSQIEGFRLEPHSKERDARVRSELGDEKADLIAGKDWNEYFLEYESEMERYEGFAHADLGFIHYGTVDWEAGDLICDFLPDRQERPDHLFSGIEDLIGTEYRTNNVTAEFRGLHLAREKIELLLPTHRLTSTGANVAPAMPEARRVGRPAKWDWEGALTHVISLAQTPDGLPTGHGAQAQIEGLIADWFTGQTGTSPSMSQVRTRAATIMRLIEKPQAENGK